MRRNVVSFPLSLGFFPAAYPYGAIGAVFPPVRFGEKLTATLGTAFQFCPVQKSGFQLPVKGKHGGNEPAAEKRITDTLDAYTRLSIVQRNTVAVIVVATLMHKPTRRPVLAVVHVGAFTVHSPAPFRAPACVLKSVQCCSLQSAILLFSPSFPGTRCKGCSSPS